MTSWVSSLTTLIALTQPLAEAIIRPDGPIPRHTTSMTIQGMSQEEHTRDSYGRFRHPFVDAPKHLQSIYYEDSRTFSTKLHRRPGRDKYAGRLEQELDWTESLLSFFLPLEATYQTPLTNYNNLNYLGEVYIGSQQSKFMVVWDTGSQDFLVEGSGCSGCNGDVFDYGSSTSFNWLSPDAYKSEEYMDGTKLSGKIGTDNVCPTTDTNSCANSFEFVVLTEAKGLTSEEDGILGMWSGNDAGSSDVHPNSLFMNKMKAAGQITEQTFSFHMSGTSGTSYIDFGTPNSGVMTQTPVYMNIYPNNKWWTASLTGFKWGSNMNDATQYKLDEAPQGLTDTGSSCIIGPLKEIRYIRNTILNKADKAYYFGGSNYGVDCASASKLPSFFLLLGGYWMEVLPEDYVIDMNDGSGMCEICLNTQRGATDWVLGDAFMRGWYSIHDHENLRMGFTPFTGSPKLLPVAGSTPSEALPRRPFVWLNGIFILGVRAWVWLLGIALLMVGILFALGKFLGCGPFSVSRKQQGLVRAKKTTVEDEIKVVLLE